MGQQSNGVGLRYGVIDGWNSSWSINPNDKIEYRDLVQVSSDLEKLVTNLFKLNQGFIGKVGISKHGQSKKLIINVFGYVPSKYKLVEDRANIGKKIRNKERMIYPQKHLRLKLYRLAQVLSKKYEFLGVTFAMKCVLVGEYEIQPKFNRRKKRQKNQSDRRVNKNFKNIFYHGPHGKSSHFSIATGFKVPAKKKGKKASKSENEFIFLNSFVIRKRFFKRRSKKVQNEVALPKVLLKSRKKFGFLKRLNYHSTLMNLAYWVFKTRQPQFLAKFLAQEFGKTRFQRSLYNNVDKVCAFLFNENKDIQGIRIQVSGRMNKSKRTRKFIVQYGAITTQTISHPLKYAFEEAYTVYGSMGVKIWISY